MPPISALSVIFLPPHRLEEYLDILAVNTHLNLTSPSSVEYRDASQPID